jgi:hypothetical protein
VVPRVSAVPVPHPSLLASTDRPLTIDYANRLTFLGDEIKNDAVQGMLSDGAESIRDQLIAVAHAYHGQYDRG